MPLPSSSRGATLVEVLIAVLVFSVGMLGAAGLMAMAWRSNQAAYLRTQVTFLAQNMAERMRANLVGVWQGAYNGSYPDDSAQDCAGGCNPAQLARHDRQRWSSQLRTFLPPGARASIDCSHADAAYAPTADQLLLRPPYGGNCSMVIRWAERGVSGSGAPMQAFAWEFQP